VSVLLLVRDIPKGLPWTKIRVVLADDHQQKITTVRRALGEGFEVVGVAEDGKKPSMLFLR
jgi:hypothetical protein